MMIELRPIEKRAVVFAITGMSNAAIATRINTTEQVVKNLLLHVSNKFGTSNRTELAYKIFSTPSLAAEYLPLCEEALKKIGA